MLKRRRNDKGFTMVELLVVLIIVGILAAVATPLYLTNVQRARASEAVAGMGLIRQAERDYQIKANRYFDIVKTTGVGNIQNGFPTSVATDGTPTLETAGVGVNVGVTQYFSNGAYTVDAAVAADEDGESTLFVNPFAVDFIIRVSGSVSADDPFGQNRLCTSTVSTHTNCALKATEVENYRLEMDNSGRVFVSYQAGAAGTWEAY